jgi:hypothetical protein
MEKEFNYILMDLVLWVSGKTIKRMVLEYLRITDKYFNSIGRREYY